MSTVTSPSRSSSSMSSSLSSPLTSPPPSLSPSSSPSFFSLSFWTRVRLYQLLIFSLTFMSYALFTAMRQPFSITKSSLDPNDNQDDDDNNNNNNNNNNSSSSDSGYAPFNSPSNGSLYTGLTDTIFLIFYAIGLFISGPLADRLNLRYFLSMGMASCGVFCMLFGIGGILSIHSLYYFLIINALHGLSQSIGWPSNVTLMTRWFGKKRLGIIVGLWNSQSSIGNIVGKVVATGAMSSWGWEYAFIVNGLMGIVGGGMIWIWMVERPEMKLSEEEMRGLEVISAGGGKGTQKKMNNEEDNENESKERMTNKVKERNNRIEISVGDDERDNNNNFLYEPLPNEDPHARNLTKKTPHSIRLNENIDFVPSPSSSLPLSSSSSSISINHSSSPHPNNALPSSSLSSSSSPSHQHPHHVLLPSEDIDDYPYPTLSEALSIPGVIEYSLCLFFCKLVAYAFLFWLPFYLKSIGYSKTTAGDFSTIFDMGGMICGIASGYLSDYSGKPGTVSCGMLLVSIPLLYLYSILSSSSAILNGILMFLLGIMINGPYTFISSIVSADLGSHSSLRGNPKAMGMITGIMDGTGSIGAACQGVIIGGVSSRWGWGTVFYILMIFCAIPAGCIGRIVGKEMGWGRKGKGKGNGKGSEKEGSDDEQGGEESMREEAAAEEDKDQEISDKGMEGNHGAIERKIQ